MFFFFWFLFYYEVFQIFTESYFLLRIHTPIMLKLHIWEKLELRITMYFFFTQIIIYLFFRSQESERSLLLFELTGAAITRRASEYVTRIAEFSTSSHR